MSELGKRSLIGVLLIGVALAAAVVGGYLFAMLVAAAACVMFYEWRRIVAGWGFGWQVAGFVYSLAPALALLWIRERFAVNGAPLRFRSQSITVGGKVYGVQVAAPLASLQQGLRDALWLLVPMFPLMLALASAGGYFMSRRALAPVVQGLDHHAHARRGSRGRKVAGPVVGSAAGRLVGIARCGHGLRRGVAWRRT
jgi:CDP-diglyceride synthetase